MEVINQVKKFFEEEMDYRSPLTSQMFTNMAASLNAFCTFAGGRCTTYNSDGSYTTLPNSSFLIIMGRGAGGGGGGGGFGAILRFNGFATSEFVKTFEVMSNPIPGGNGSPGGNAIFGTDIVAAGGQGGWGGRWVPPTNQVDEVGSTIVYNSNGVRDIFQEYIDDFNCRFEGEKACGGAGGLGRVSGIISNSQVQFEDDHTLAGLKGHYGQSGNYGIRTIKAPPNTTFAVTVGAGGAGGIAPTQNSGGGLTATGGATNGRTGKNGTMTIYEFGF